MAIQSDGKIVAAGYHRPAGQDGDFALARYQSNTPPTFTSATTASVAEGSTAVQTITATDPDLPAQTITYSISGGADQASFEITAANQLSFIAAPDFENPTDTGVNNVYEVQVNANDGNGGTTTQLVSVTVTNVTATISGTVWTATACSTAAPSRQSTPR